MPGFLLLPARQAGQPQQQQTRGKQRPAFRYRQKKTVPVIRNGSAKCGAYLFNRSHQAFKSLRIVHGQICQYFTIQFDSFFTQFVNEYRIG